MTEKNLVGLLKFFRSEEYLNQLVGGLLYCNTSEFYRLSREEGQSDPYESCVHAYRRNRGDAETRIEINGLPLPPLTAATMYGGDLKDTWTHCWFALDAPENEDELIPLTADLDRVRKEFGSQYVFLYAEHMAEFVQRAKSLYNEKLRHGRVIYSDDNEKWSVGCKSIGYSYQREYRFAFGQCDHMCIEPKQLICGLGFKDLLQKNPRIRILCPQTQSVWFRLDESGSYCDH